MTTGADRGWMYDVEDTDRFLSHTFCSNLEVFLDFAFSNKAVVDNNRIKCPCLECDNKHFKTRNDVMFHLYEKGFTPNYTTWSAHGETTTSSRKDGHEGKFRHLIEDDNDRKLMVVNEMVPANVRDTGNESSCDSNVFEVTKGCQKNLKVKLTPEFKCKSKNKINMLAQTQNEMTKIIKNHGALNNSRVSTTDTRLSIFKHAGQKLLESVSRYTYMPDEMSIAHHYILFNCEEVKPFIRLFDDLTRQRQPDIDEWGRDIYRKNFAEWFEEQVRQGSNDISQNLKEIALRLGNGVWTYKGYSINGYKFHTHKHSEGKATKLSGVCVRGSVDNEYERDYYGILDDIVEVKFLNEYRIPTCGVVVLFKCKWFDTPGGVGVKRKNNLVHIDSKAKLLTDNPFVFPSQTEQVYYAPYPSMSKELKDWWDAVKIQDEVKEHI